MATINDKLEQQGAQTKELTEDELDQSTGGWQFVVKDEQYR